MKKLTKIALIGSLSLVFAASTGYAVFEKNQLVAKGDTGFDLSLDLVNAKRSAINRQPLNWSDKLAKAAEDKANDIFQNQYFDHTSKSGKTAWDFVLNENYDYKYAGENLGIDYANISSVFNAWVDSPSHYANIASEKFTDYGFYKKEGVLDGKNTIVYVQIFGSR